MPLRFRRSLRLLSGVRLNFSKSGTSVSVGAPGATVNFSKRGVYGTAGLPGTGISVRERLGASHPGPKRPARSWVIGISIMLAAALWALLSGL